MAEAAAGPATPLPASFPGRGSTATSTSGPAIATITARGLSCRPPAPRSTRARRWCRRGVAAPGARGAPDRRRQRLVLVVRRRPLVGPRRRLRRSVPPPSAERLRRARCAGPRRPVRHQHHDRPGSRSAGAVGLPDRDPGRPGHLLTGVGGRRVAVAGASRAARCSEVAAASLVAGDRRSAWSRDALCVRLTAGRLSLGAGSNGAALALIVGREPRSASLPIERAWLGVGSHRSRSVIPFDRARRRPRRRPCSSRVQVQRPCRRRPRTPSRTAGRGRIAMSGSRRQPIGWQA